MGAVTVRMDELVPPGDSVTVLGLKLVVNCEKLLRDMLPENPLRLVRSIFAVSDPPGASVI